jgi:hypothetical protein
MVAQVGYSMAGRSRDRLALCAVCIVHVETRSVNFLVEPQDQVERFVSGLTSKSLGRLVSSLASKPLGRFLWFGLKIGGDGFSRFGLKIRDSGFPIWASKPAATVW